jgi:cytidyltransferase-like protein
MLDVGLIVGCFDPFHEGHKDHLLKASRLCRYLIIVTHSNEVLIQKKGYYIQSYEIRKNILEGLMMLCGIKGRVEQAMEDSIGGNYKDGISLSLALFKPNVFFKGGDRTPDNMPQSEIDTCNRLGIEIKYGVGDLLSSSSKTIENAFKVIQERK